MSASSMDLPPDPPASPPEPPARAPNDAGQALQLTLRFGARPIATSVNVRGGPLLPDAPVDLVARRVDGGWVIEGPAGTTHVTGGARVALRQGDMEVEVEQVPQSRFARFGWEQGDAVLPVLLFATTVLGLQLALLWKILSGGPAGGAGFEPTPEYIARLLDEQFEGKEQGILAPQAPRPEDGEPINSFYLPPGHDGPRDHLGGGKNVGDHIADGDLDGKERHEAPASGGAGAVVQRRTRAADGAGKDESEDRPIAVHVDKGWGLTDWYDTKDAREDAKEIQKVLEETHDILRLDPNDRTGLSVRAYYEYLAMEPMASRKTYEKFTALYPEEPAGWNNLALTYKRTGDYKKEEALYQIALNLSPDDDHALVNLALCLAHQGRFDEALAIMKKLEVISPGDPYCDLHRAKIYGAMGKEEESYGFLEKSLAGMKELDTLHNIEFRQDIRVDPAFEAMRKEPRFATLLERYYGKASARHARKGSK